ncbi:hypothetical protein TIFTF001_024920 [Ficus carica]|uniref:Uncharacterized protein n=1 Tax=Ficus carica TaxID=3494 RepID=A0AA88DF60_FICCA|nr:hypothetical protein TIFTF001_024920 [Ficus carica]
MKTRSNEIWNHNGEKTGSKPSAIFCGDEATAETKSDEHELQQWQQREIRSFMLKIENILMSNPTTSAGYSIDVVVGGGGGSCSRSVVVDEVRLLP